MPALNMPLDSQAAPAPKARRLPVPSPGSSALAHSVNSGRRRALAASSSPSALACGNRKEDSSRPAARVSFPVAAGRSERLRRIAAGRVHEVVVVRQAVIHDPGIEGIDLVLLRLRKRLL